MHPPLPTRKLTTKNAPPSRPWDWATHPSPGIWDVIHHRSNPAGGEGKCKNARGAAPRAWRPGRGLSTLHTRPGGSSGTGVGDWSVIPIDICIRFLMQLGMQVPCPTGREETAGSATHSAASMLRGFIRLYGHPPRPQPPWDTPGPYETQKSRPSYILGCGCVVSSRLISPAAAK